MEVNLSISINSCILDARSDSHICLNMYELKGSKMLKKNEVIIRVGNGARVAASIVGTYHLFLPSGLALELNNCYYIPVLTANIISISC